MIGRTVGNYKIIETLGEGGVGMVYKGVDTMLDREVAIKVLRPGLASQTAIVERFRSEAVTLAKLNHPNIATLYSLQRQSNDLFMILEFINGETLDRLLHRRGRLPVEEALPIFCQALEGISYAHDRGVVHRDIKPGNMILTEDSVLKVLDFGIARLFGTSRMTRQGNVIGTLEYMSPEQVRGLETDARSDVYGLGILLYELLTGQLPFESENDFELMKMQTELLPPLPRTLVPEIPPAIEAAIMRAISKVPADRFQRAGDFRDALVESSSLVRNTGPGPVYRPMPSPLPSDPGFETTRSDEKAISPVSANEAPASAPILTPKMPITVETGRTEKRRTGETRDVLQGRAPISRSETKGTRLSSSTPTSPVDATEVPVVQRLILDVWQKTRPFAATFGFRGVAAGFIILLSSALMAIAPMIFFGGALFTGPTANSGLESGGSRHPDLRSEGVRPTVRVESTPNMVESPEPVSQPRALPAASPEVRTPVPSPTIDEQERKIAAPAERTKRPVERVKPDRPPIQKRRMNRLRDLMTDN